MRGSVERTPEKLLHALLLHGVRARTSTLEDFWPLVLGLNGRAITRNTGSSAVAALEAHGVVRRRPLRFGPGLGFVIGVAVGSQSLRAGLFDANGDLLRRPDFGDGSRLSDYHAFEEPRRPGQLAEARDLLLRRIVSAVSRVAQGALDDPSLLRGGRLPFLGVAVAWPSPLNRWTKAPTGSALEDAAWHQVDAMGAEVVGVDTLVARSLGLGPEWSHAMNDANGVALAAAFDRSRDPTVGRGGGGVVMALRAGGGVGAGTVVSGSSADELPRSHFLTARLLEGVGGYAGELGHWQVPREDLVDILGSTDSGQVLHLDPKPCVCGRSRCLETVAGGLAVAGRLEAAGLDLDEIRRLDYMDSFAAARAFEADPTSRAAVFDAGRIIGRSLSAPILMLNPESVTISGSTATEALRAGIDHEKRSWEHVHEDAPRLLLLAGVDNKLASARGAALAVFRARVYRRFELGAELASAPLALDQQMVDAWVAGAAARSA